MFLARLDSNFLFKDLYDLSLLAIQWRSYTNSMLLMAFVPYSEVGDNSEYYEYRYKRMVMLWYVDGYRFAYEDIKHS